MGVLPQIGKGGWYLLHGDKPHGPFPVSAFLEAVEEGTITKDHLVWRPGWSDWRRGSAAAELLTISPSDEAIAEFSAMPPPPPAEPEKFDEAAEPPANAVDRALPETDVANLEFMSATLERQLMTDLDLPPDQNLLSRRNYFLDHWHGELSLLKSYWVSTALVVALICSAIFALRLLLESVGQQRGLVALAVWGIFCLVALALLIWQFVGLWRSASFHPERGGSVFWARVAQVLVVIVASAGIITWIADSSRFASSGTLADLSSAQKIRDSLIKVPAYATLQRVAPTEFDSLSARVADGFHQDVDDDAVISAARIALEQAIKRYAPRASDDAILDKADVSSAYMNALQATDPESCVAINDASKGARLRANLLKQYPAIFNRELAADEEILATGSDHAQPVPAQSQVALQLTTVQAQMTHRFDRQLALLSKQDLKPSEYPTYCQIALALYEEIRRLPPKQAVDLLRYIYTQS
jgi:hypothetical protein